MLGNLREPLADKDGVGRVLSDLRLIVDVGGGDFPIGAETVVDVALKTVHLGLSQGSAAAA